MSVVVGNNYYARGGFRQRLLLRTLPSVFVVSGIPSDPETTHVLSYTEIKDYTSGTARTVTETSGPTNTHGCLTSDKDLDPKNNDKRGVESRKIHLFSSFILTVW